MPLLLLPLRMDSLPAERRTTQGTPVLDPATNLPAQRQQPRLMSLLAGSDFDGTGIEVIDPWLQRPG